MGGNPFAGNPTEKTKRRVAARGPAYRDGFTNAHEVKRLALLKKRREMERTAEERARKEAQMKH